MRARPENPMLDKEGGHHAKVLFGTSTRTAIIGSCNFTTSSQCNVELTAKVALSASGTVQLTAWFEKLWSEAVPHVISSGSAPSRSPHPRAEPRSRRAAGRPRSDAGEVEPAPSALRGGPKESLRRGWNCPGDRRCRLAPKGPQLFSGPLFPPPRTFCGELQYRGVAGDGTRPRPVDLHDAETSAVLNAGGAG